MKWGPFSPCYHRPPYNFTFWTFFSSSSWKEIEGATVPGGPCWAWQVMSGLADMVVLNDSNGSTQQLCWHFANTAVHKWLYTGAQEKQRCLVGRHFLAQVTQAMPDRCHMVPDGAGLRAHVSDSRDEDFVQGWRMAWGGADKVLWNGVLLFWPIFSFSMEKQSMLKRLAIRQERKSVWSPKPRLHFFKKA